MEVHVISAKLSKVMFKDAAGALKEIDRSLFDSRLQSGEYTIKSIKTKCLGKKQGPSGSEVYTLVDVSGNKKDFSHSVIKDALINYKITCTNLSLTPKGNIVFVEGASSVNVQGANNVKNVNNKSLSAITPSTKPVVKKTVRKTKEKVPEYIVEDDPNAKVLYIKGAWEQFSIGKPNWRCASSLTLHDGDRFIIRNRMEDNKGSSAFLDFADVSDGIHYIKGDNIKQLVFDASRTNKNTEVTIDEVAAQYLHITNIKMIKCKKLWAKKMFISTTAINPDGNLEITANELSMYSDMFKYSYNELLMSGKSTITFDIKSKLTVPPKFIIGVDPKEPGEVLKSLVEAGRIKFNVPYNSPAFNVLMSFGIICDSSEISSDKLQQMQKMQVKEDITQTSAVDTVTSKAVKVMELFNASLDNYSEAIKGLDITLKDSLLELYGIPTLNTEPSNTMGGHLKNVIETIMDLVPVNASLFDAKITERILSDIDFSKQYESILHYEKTEIGLMFIRHNRFKESDKYVIIRNGNKLIHIGMVESLQIQTDYLNKDINTYSNIYDLFDKINGIEENYLIQRLTVSAISKEELNKAEKVIRKLLELSGVLFNSGKTQVIRANNKYRVFKGSKVDSDGGKVILGDGFFKYSIRYGRIETEDVQAILDQIRNKNKRLYSKSLTKKLIEDTEFVASDDVLELRPQKISKYWVLAQALRIELLTNVTYTNFFRNLDNNIVSKLFTMLNFVEVDGKTYKNTRETRGLTISSDDYKLEVMAISINGKNKIPNSLSYKYIEKIMYQNKETGEVHFYFSSMTLDDMFKKLRSVVDGKHNFKIADNINKVYSSFALSSQLLISERCDLNYMELTQLGGRRLFEIESVILFKSPLWYTKTEQILRQLQVVMDANTGLLYGVIVEIIKKASKQRTKNMSLTERVVFKIPDTEKALKLIMRYNIEDGNRKLMSLTNNLISVSESFDKKLNVLQLKNEKDVNKYKNTVGKVFDLYKEYLAYTPDKLEVEEV